MFHLDLTVYCELLIKKQIVSVEAAQKLKYPLPLAGTALQLFQLASLRGLGKEPDVAVSRIWDGVNRPLFPGSKA